MQEGNGGGGGVCDTLFRDGGEGGSITMLTDPQV